MARVTRRGFLRSSGQGLIGTASILGGAPAGWVVTNASKPKEAMVWAETEIKRMFAR